MLSRAFILGSSNAFNHFLRVAPVTLNVRTHGTKRRQKE